MNEIKQVSLDLIDDPKIAMRGDFDGEKLAELMASMKEIGLIEPVVLRPVGDRYEVIAGHRRTRSARLLNWPTIEAKIVATTDDGAFEMRIAENFARQDLDIIEEACFVGEIILKHKKSPEEVAKLHKRSVGWIEDRLAVFEMPQYMQDHLKLKKYPLGAALWIAKIEDERTRNYYANWAALNGVSVTGAKVWYDTFMSQRGVLDMLNIEIKDEGGTVQRVRSQTTCEACRKSLFLDEARSVFIHEICPEDAVETPAPISSEVKA